MVNIFQIWEKKGYEIVIGFCFLFILIASFYRKITGQKGTWSRSYFYDKMLTSKPSSELSPASYLPKQSKGEIECRRVLENFFPGYKFPNKRPDFMKNQITNKNLEIDCYCSQLGLAVEYHGQQHYKYIPYFHSNIDKFRTQQYRDLLTRDLCQKNNIKLIEVPYTVKIPDIEQYLKKKINQLGYKVNG